MSNLNSREEFRTIVTSLVQCAKGHLDRPGISPFTPEEVHSWLAQITVEDVRAAFAKLQQKGPTSP